ncbi:FBP domain-containing protein [Marisediminicola sp. LYQ85]|uniref:FBP domain-containing protein n=1 Tax=Marisediminicola sp. LYQ85 TaxID=3391062 RepID=UPI0039839EAF
MFPLTDKAVRASFINASRKETTDITLPTDFDDLDWGSLDFLGWRDPRQPRRAYAVIPTLDGDPVGILFKQADASPRSRAQCSWCQDVRLPNDVVFYSAKRPGPAGRNGNTVGTLVCQEFQCSANVRKDPPLAYEGFDLAAARLQRIHDLRIRTASFAATLGGGA